MLASVEWPGLTYLLRRPLEKFEHNGQEWDRSWGDLIDSLKNFAVICDPDVWRVLESLLRTRWKGTPNSLWDYRPGEWCVQFCWISGGDVSAGCVHYTSTLRDEVSLQATSSVEVYSLGSCGWHLATSSRIVDRSWSCQDYAAAKYIFRTSPIANPATDQIDREHYPCRIVSWCQHNILV